MTTTITETERAVAEMLVENTGTHMLDSGGSSGRAWQRNQKAVGEQDPAEFFKNRPMGSIDFSEPHPVFYENDYPRGIRPAEINYITVDVFHWMTGPDSTGSERYEYLPDEDAAFVKWVEEQDEGKDSWD